MTTVHKSKPASQTHAAATTKKTAPKSSVHLKGGVKVNGKAATFSPEGTLGIKKGALKGKGAALHKAAETLARTTRPHGHGGPAATA